MQDETIIVEYCNIKTRSIQRLFCFFLTVFKLLYFFGGTNFPTISQMRNAHRKVHGMGKRPYVVEGGGICACQKNIDRHSQYAMFSSTIHPCYYLPVGPVRVFFY